MIFSTVIFLSVYFFHPEPAEHCTLHYLSTIPPFVMIEESVQSCFDGKCATRLVAAETTNADNTNAAEAAGIEGANYPCNIADQSDTNQEKIANEKISKSNSRRNKKKNESSSKSSSIIKTLHSQQDLDAFLSTNDAVIIEFMTTWCGACRSIEEYYQELTISNEEYNVRSAMVICDKNKQTKKLATIYNVKSYPVFVAFKDGVISNRFDGADKGKLEATFERLGGGSGSGGKKKKRGGRLKRM